MDIQPPVDPNTSQAATPTTNRTALDDAHDFIRSIAGSAKKRAEDQRASSRESRAVARRNAYATRPESHDAKLRGVKQTVDTLHGRDIQVNGNVISKRDNGSNRSFQTFQTVGLVNGIPTNLTVNGVIGNPV